MIKSIEFSEALEAVERLGADDQVELLAILTRRMAERGRERVAQTVEQSRRQFASGQCRTISPADLVREALS